MALKIQHTAHHHSLYGKSHSLLNHIRHHFGDGYIENGCNFARKQIICQPPIQPGEKKRQESHTNWCAYPVNSPAQPPFFFYISTFKNTLLKFPTLDTRVISKRRVLISHEIWSHSFALPYRLTVTRHPFRNGIRTADR